MSAAVMESAAPMTRFEVAKDQNAEVYQQVIQEPIVTLPLGVTGAVPYTGGTSSVGIPQGGTAPASRMMTAPAPAASAASAAVYASAPAPVTYTAAAPSVVTYATAPQTYGAAVAPGQAMVMPEPVAGTSASSVTGATLPPGQGSLCGSCYGLPSEAVGTYQVPVTPHPGQEQPAGFSQQSSSPSPFQFTATPNQAGMFAMPSLGGETNGQPAFGFGGRPLPPHKLTEHIPDPQSIDTQKQAYAKSLDQQLEQGTRMLQQHNEVQKQALRQAAEQHRIQFDMQVDQELKAQEMSVDQQANYQLMGLQQAAHEQKALLESQANQAILEYEQSKVQDEFAAQQYEYQKKAYEKQQEMERAMEKQRQAYMAQQRALHETYAMHTVNLQVQAAGSGCRGGGLGVKPTPSLLSGLGFN